MSGFSIAPNSIKREVPVFINSAQTLRTNADELRLIAEDSAFNGAAYSQVRTAILGLSDTIVKEAVQVELLGTKLDQIVLAYEQADENIVANISKNNNPSAIDDNKKDDSESDVEPDYDYQKEVDEIYHKLTDESIPWAQRMLYLDYLLAKASFLIPSLCMLSKAEKEALIKFFGEAITSSFGDLGIELTEKGELWCQGEGGDFLNSDAMNLVERYMYNKYGLAISYLLGFSYNSDGNSYYTKEGCNQQNFGFSDGIDALGPYIGMDLDTDVKTFTVNGKEHRVQLWKGNYGWGSAVGSEIGFYSRSEAEAAARPYTWESEDSKYILFESASQEDQPRIIQTTTYTDKNGDTHSYTCDTDSYGDGNDFWNLNIRTEAGVKKSDVDVKYTIDCSKQGAEYARAMYEAFSGDPRVKVSYDGGTTVTILY